MRTVDIAKAFGVAIATLIITIAASFPMVAFYSYFIEPGHPPEFYTDAAQWIAPWSSHILGPVCFLVFNFWLARRSPQRNGNCFAAATIGAYLVIELVLMAGLGQPLTSLFSVTFGLSFLAKIVGAFLGAYFGSVKSESREVSTGAV